MAHEAGRGGRGRIWVFISMRLISAKPPCCRGDGGGGGGLEGAEGPEVGGGWGWGLSAMAHVSIKGQKYPRGCGGSGASTTRPTGRVQGLIWLLSTDSWSLGTVCLSVCESDIMSVCLPASLPVWLPAFTSVCESDILSAILSASFLGRHLVCSSGNSVTSAFCVTEALSHFPFFLLFFFCSFACSQFEAAKKKKKKRTNT